MLNLQTYQHYCFVDIVNRNGASLQGCHQQNDTLGFRANKKNKRKTALGKRNGPNSKSRQSIEKLETFTLEK